MSDALVSIIIPIYNVEKYLRESLERVVNQTYKNLEIILLNDGSTDSSLDICNDYKAQDNRIKVIDKVNSGQGDTRNKGIEMATGKYIYFADSDDLIDYELIETAVAGIEEKESDIYIFNYYHVYEKEDGQRKNVEEREFIEGSYRLDLDKDKLKFITNNYLNYGCGFEVWDRLYRADIIKDNSIRFPVFKPVIAEDVCFNLFYLMHVNKIEVTNKRLYYYLYRTDSSMGADRSVVRVNQYNRLSKCLYEYVQSINNLYIKNNYYMIHILLLYHELMNVRLDDMRNEIGTVEDNEYNNSRLSESRGKIFRFISTMGLMRGIKYYLFSGYYYNGNRLKYYLLRFLCK
jgi:glycosyltransferase involved in cell wall biosynthesis